MKVAVIGAGVSGLVVARKLHARHDVTVFEAGDEPGGHSRTIDVSRGGRTYAIDTGFVVFNDRTYPEFLRILGDLGVPAQPSEMSFSVRCERTGIEYSGASLNAVFAQRRNLLRPTFLRLMCDYLRFNRQAPTLLEADERAHAGRLPGEARGSRAPFASCIWVPMGSAIWSTDPARFGQIPVRSFVRFFHNHGLLGIRGKPRWSLDQRRRARVRRGAGAAISRSNPNPRAGDPCAASARPRRRHRGRWACRPLRPGGARDP